MSQLRLVVVGTLASIPYAGMTWMTMQIVAGLRKLGHDAYYFETTSSWPYDPIRRAAVDDSRYAVPYLRRVAEGFGLADRWAYRRSYSDKQWFGLPQKRAETLLAEADAVINVAGATRLAEEGLKVGRLVYLGTDPGYHELSLINGDTATQTIIDEHDDAITYGENIGTPASPIPPLPGLRGTTRQPVLLELWRSGPPARPTFTTVGNWRQTGRDVEYGSRSYSWSKHHEFLKVAEVPAAVEPPVELATVLDNVPSDDRKLLARHGWRLVDAEPFSKDPWSYRDYICASAGEFTVAKEQNVKLCSGWFSERSACYLAAGRPVITQDTGFGRALPTGEGLFAWASPDDAVAAFEAVSSDYDRHRRAALEIAQEHFRAESVLSDLLDDLNL